MTELSGDLIEDYSEAQTEYVLVYNSENQTGALYRKVSQEYRKQEIPDFSFHDPRREIWALVNCGNVKVFPKRCPEGGLPGPRGHPGIPGQPGTDGVPGNPGPSGAPGLPGSPGPSGGPGSPGLEGFSGLRGNSGHSGTPGLSGSQGIPGISGSEGLPGLLGPNGKNGISGKDGTPGLAGSRGFPGVSGSPGLPGLPGSRGFPGISGSPGLPGLSGHPGLQGVPGISGKNGISGTPGSPGISGKRGISGYCPCISAFAYVWNDATLFQGQQGLDPYTQNYPPGLGDPGVNVIFVPSSDPPVQGIGFTDPGNSLIIETSGYYSARYGINFNTNGFVSIQLLNNNQPIPGSPVFIEQSSVIENTQINGSVIFYANSGDVIQLANNSTLYTSLFNAPYANFQYPNFDSASESPSITGNTLQISLATDQDDSSVICVSIQSTSEVQNVTDGTNIYSRVARANQSNINNEIWVTSPLNISSETLNIVVSFSNSDFSATGTAFQITGTAGYDLTGFANFQTISGNQVVSIGAQIPASSQYDICLISIAYDNLSSTFNFNNFNSVYPSGTFTDNVIGGTFGFGGQNVLVGPNNLSVDCTLQDQTVGNFVSIGISLKPEVFTQTYNFVNPIINAYLELISIS